MHVTERRTYLLEARGGKGADESLTWPCPAPAPSGSDRGPTLGVRARFPRRDQRWMGALPAAPTPLLVSPTGAAVAASSGVSIIVAPVPALAPVIAVSVLLGAVFLVAARGGQAPPFVGEERPQGDR